MIPVVLLANAAVGVAGVAIAAPGRPRLRALWALAGVGGVSGVALCIASTIGASWRGFVLEPSTGVPAGAGIAAAWAVFVALDRGRGDVGVAPALGAAGSAVALATAARWAVPFLLLWLCAALAIATVPASGERAMRPRVEVAAAAALLVVVVAIAVLPDGPWVLPRLDAWAVGALAAAALAHAAAWPGSGSWSHAGTRAASMLPLRVGAAAALPGLFGAGGEWPIVALLAMGAAGVAAWACRRCVPALVGPAAVLLAFAGGFALPASAAAGGVAAVAAASAVVVWPRSPGRGMYARAALILPVPLTVAYLAPAAAAEMAVARFVGAVSPAARAGWSASAALLVAALAAGAALAARVARRGGHGFDPEAVVVTWGLAAAGVGVGILPSAIGAPPSVSSGAGSLMALTALVAGLVVARLLPSPSGDQGVADEGPVEVTLTPRPALDRVLGVLALVLAAAAGGVAAWVAIAGLRLGFL